MHEQWEPASRRAAVIVSVSSSVYTVAAPHPGIGVEDLDDFRPARGGSLRNVGQAPRGRELRTYEG